MFNPCDVLVQLSTNHLNHQITMLSRWQRKNKRFTDKSNSRWVWFLVVYRNIGLNKCKMMCEWVCVYFSVSTRNKNKKKQNFCYRSGSAAIIPMILFSSIERLLAQRQHTISLIPILISSPTRSRVCACNTSHWLLLTVYPTPTPNQIRHAKKHKAN